MEHGDRLETGFFRYLFQTTAGFCAAVAVLAVVDIFFAAMLMQRNARVVCMRCAEGYKAALGISSPHTVVFEFYRTGKLCGVRCFSWVMQSCRYSV